MRNQDLPPFLTESFLVCRQAGLPVLSSLLDCVAASLVAHAVVKKGSLEMLQWDVSAGGAGTAISCPALESPLLPKSHILRGTQCTVLFIV